MHKEITRVAFKPLRLPDYLSAFMPSIPAHKMIVSAKEGKRTHKSREAAQKSMIKLLN